MSSCRFLRIEEKLITYQGTRKNLQNMKVTVIPIIVGALDLIPKTLVKRLGKLEIRGRIETARTTAPMKSA